LSDNNDEFFRKEFHMDQYMTILRGLMLAVALASIFAISVATLLIIINRAQFFSGRSRSLVAVSLSILFLVALSNFLIWPREAILKADSEFAVKVAGYSMLPGVALGVAAAVVLSQVLVLANKTTLNEKSVIGTKRTVSDGNKPKDTTAKSKPGRPKKVESKNPPALQKPAGKGKNEVKMNTSAEGTKT
jgi:hypothetical protein